MATATVNEGLYRIGAQYGEVQMGSQTLFEVVEITATIEVNRIEIPLVGSTRQGYKPGREARDGTFRIQKLDSRWELGIHKFIGTSLTDRRNNRGNWQRPFDLEIVVNDPDALGYERWRLNGCLLWRLPLGFSITDDILDREFPFTWETEHPVESFVRSRPAALDDNGRPVITQYDATTPLNYGDIEL